MHVQFTHSKPGIFGSDSLNRVGQLLIQHRGPSVEMECDGINLADFVPSVDGVVVVDDVMAVNFIGNIRC